MHGGSDQVNCHLACKMGPDYCFYKCSQAERRRAKYQNQNKKSFQELALFLNKRDDIDEVNATYNVRKLTD